MERSCSPFADDEVSEESISERFFRRKLPPCPGRQVRSISQILPGEKKTNIEAYGLMAPT